MSLWALLSLCLTGLLADESYRPTRALGLFKPGSSVGLEEGFADPPPICRVQCWWQCHGSAFSESNITRQLAEFKQKGWGGVTIKDTLPMPRDEHTAHIRDIRFMSPEWLDKFAYIVGQCDRLGLICRSRLGSGWNCGGPWVTPDISSQRMVVGRAPAQRGWSGPIPLGDDGDPNFNALRRGMAFVVAQYEGHARGIDLTDRVGEDRSLRWEVPKGRWNLFTCASRPSGIPVVSCSPSGAGLHHDHLSAAGTDLQLARVAEPMIARLGRKTSAFDGFNVDSWELGNPTWTAGMREAFRARRGYDPVPYLPVLADVKDEGIGRKPQIASLAEEAQRFLFDLRTTASELIIETHYRRISQWCRQRGIVLEAQAGGPMVVPRDLLAAQGSVDIPMGEFWMHPWTCVKTASSAAHAYGKPLVGLESFTDTRREQLASPPAQMKPRVDEAFLLGGNYLTMSVVEFSPAEAGIPGWVHNAGPHLNPSQTWWPLARPFFDYLARCCFLLQSGRPIAHVAEYRNMRIPEGQLWREPDDKLSTYPKEFAFDYAGDDLVQNHMSVRGGRIELRSGATYGLLYVVPTEHPSMPLATLAKIAQLVRLGAKVVWAGPPPERCPGLSAYPQCDAQFRQVAKELFADPRLVKIAADDRSQLVPLVERSLCPPAWLVEGDPPLRFVHRRTTEADIFFVVNRAKTDVDCPVWFRIEGRHPELWDPDSGRIQAAEWEKDSWGIRVRIALAGQGSTFVVFRDSTKNPSRSLPAPSRQFCLEGPWQVRFTDARGSSSAQYSKLESWTESTSPSVRYFSGIATYRTRFRGPELPAKSAVLDLGRVADVCEVVLNGKNLGIGWHPPYRFEVAGALRAGDNDLEIRVANMWQNRIVGDANLPPEKRVTRIVPETHYQRLRGGKLVESGLIGPVECRTGF